MLSRVAGESMLVGITDQQINLIKSLSLLDEEIPDKVPLDFEKTLKEKNITEVKDKKSEEVPGGFNLSSIDDVRDYISNQYVDN